MAIKVSTWITMTDEITGEGSINIKIPGSFTTIDSTSSLFSGRQLLNAALWVEARHAGDAVIQAYINDTDGVIPVQIRGLFPHYPILRNLHDDAVSSDNQGISLLPSGPFMINFPTAGAAKVASGLYLIVVFKKNTPAIDTCFVNIAMDDLT